jgi:cysteine synthase
MLAAMKFAERLTGGAVVVTIFCDSAAKYLSESFWSEASHEAEIWP